MKINWEQLREKVRTTDKAILLKVVQSIDGHTIYDPKQFTEQGLAPDIVKAFTKTLKSGQDPKEMIFDKDNQVIKTIKGVYGLNLLQFIASSFNVTTWKMGRGSGAVHLIEQLTEKFTHGTN